ncbi:J domain-containing protein [uncultured Clostridium sp.]|uniref:J domain-containing protein n=1 Tax=uncultured Clostridium sp. TaxID=59620 RepID=UPI0025F0D41B|nr:J domain-containing protein [uncultured Clostridium sp.]
MDPYKVLGIMPHSSEKEVKEAYSKIVETYNPSDLEDDSVKSFYEEKLNEANEAYRIIHHNMTCEEVRDLIEKDDFIFAETKLNMVSDLSSAEWNYLKGILLIKKGWIDSGVNHIKKATTLNPYNSEYLTTLRKLNQKVGSYKTNFNPNQKQAMNPLCGGNNNNGKGGLC